MTPFRHRGGMIFATRCAGCHARGPVLCRTCRFALVARPAPGTPDGHRRRHRLQRSGPRRAARAQVPQPPPGRRPRRRRARRTPRWRRPPTSTSSRGRRRARRGAGGAGFDQAELIARAVAAHLGLPCRRLLERDGTAAGPDRAQPAPTTVRAALPGPPAGRRAPCARRRRRRHHRRDARRRGAVAPSTAGPPTSCSLPSRPPPTACCRRRGWPSIAAVARWAAETTERTGTT